MTVASASGRHSRADRARVALLAIPGLRMVRTYDRGWLPTDALAALTVWALLVPQALAYSQLGGFDPVVGLYASIGALAGYVLLGGVREMSVGPEATIALLTASVIAPARRWGPGPVPGARRRRGARGRHPPDARGPRATGVRDALPLPPPADRLRGGLGDRDDHQPARFAPRPQARRRRRLARRAGRDDPADPRGRSADPRGRAGGHRRRARRAPARQAAARLPHRRPRSHRGERGPGPRGPRASQSSVRSRRACRPSACPRWASGTLPGWSCPRRQSACSSMPTAGSAARCSRGAAATGSTATASSSGWVRPTSARP